jgi:hypothetical protein
MDWMNAIGGLLQQYTGSNTTPQNASDVENHFDQVAQAAPQSALADGLAAAFRSNETPAFGQMVATLFNNASGQQKASILNTLIAAAGPTILSQVLSRGGSGLSGLTNLLGSGQTTVTPEQAQDVSPDAVQHIATEAEKNDPSIVDRLSHFYSEHPTLVKTLGAAALTIALARVAEYQRQSQ